MIQINLLPGSGKKSRGRGQSVAVGAMFAGAASKIKDPFLLIGTVGFLVAGGAVALLHWHVGGRADVLAERERAAVQDSTRYAAVLGERNKAQAQRDSVMRQLDIIRAIDNDRYVWSHVMDEVSRALPPYTWLTTLEQTSTPALPMAAKSAAAPAKDAKGAKDAKTADPAADSAAAVLKFQLVGQTPDIQALTRFMRVLEASPFVENVTLAKSDLVAVDGREVTEFRLDAEYQRPDSAAIRTVPVSLSVVR